MTMTTQQRESVGKFLVNAKQLLAQAKRVNATAVFYDRLTRSEKKAVCTLGNTESRATLTARHIDMSFEEMSRSERRAVFRGIEALKRLSGQIPIHVNIGDCD
ncbi:MULTISPECIES: hypothetical protein [Serratia]|uniref:hypothetical protein n=1 Tax=Serratia TaxID=613 RepID=UPI000CF68D06|nr:MULTISPECIES: hypothetical protein [Serratia]AVJ18297.1 hypothetical protein CLM71_14690 [Serratia sp. MYb239]MEB6336625.1 hypothetical protein [Serratia rhizosphaerae]